MFGFFARPVVEAVMLPVFNSLEFSQTAIEFSDFTLFLLTVYFLFSFSYFFYDMAEWFWFKKIYKSKE